MALQGGIKMKFGDLLRKLREEKGITQKKLGEIIGKSNRVISYYENEMTEDNYPDDETLREIAKYFNVSISFLLGLDDVKLTPKMALVMKLIEVTSNNELNWDVHRYDEDNPGFYGPDEDFPINVYNAWYNGFSYEVSEQASGKIVLIVRSDADYDRVSIIEDDEVDLIISDLVEIIENKKGSKSDSGFIKEALSSFNALDE